MDYCNNTFPASEVEFLASLYMQHQNLTNLSPVEILELYQSAKKSIANRIKEQNDAKYECL